MNTYNATILDNLNNALNRGSFVRKVVSTYQDMPVSAVKATGAELDLTIEEAKNGTRRSLEIDDVLGCDQCTKLVNQSRCHKCRGSGYVQVKRRVEIELSAGLMPGQQITYAEIGRFDFRSGKKNDLTITININTNAELELCNA